MKERKTSKAEFFGFELTKTGAQIVYILGILLLIGTLLSSLWVIYWAWNSYMVWQRYVNLGLSGYYQWTMWSWLPYVVVMIALIILAIYMIQCGKKGR